MAERKTALKKNPSVKKVERTEEQKTAARQTRLRHLMKVRPNDPEIKKLQQQLGPQATPGAAGPTQVSPQDMAQQAQNLYGQMAGYAQQFNPNTFQQQYQPQFQQQMDRAYNAVMSQFDIRNQRAFDQQKQDLDQEAAMKGWDPAGANYQRRYREMMDAQNQARQEAQNAATQQAYNVQQQGYQQAQGTALLPGQVAAGFMDPYQQERAFQQQKLLGAQQHGFRMQEIKATPRGGGGGGGPAYDAYSQYELARLGQQYAPEPQKPNPWAQAGQAALTSFGAAAANQLGKKILG